MSHRAVCLSLGLSLVATTAACTSSSPAQPSSSTTSSTGLSASIVAPKPVAPANNASVPNASQPVVLSVQNATSTGGPLIYKFEVATDQGFTSMTQTKDQVAEGSGGQTSATLEVLAPARDYYWHARASGGGTTGLFGATYKFTVGPAINAPSAVAPVSGATTEGWPLFVVTNATRVGTSGAIVYRFDIATSAAFTSTLVSGTVGERQGQTSFTPPAGAQPPAQTLFWRATAIDQGSGTASAASATQSFTPHNTAQSNLAANLGVTLWPSAQPSGSHGHATMGYDPEFGIGWDIQTRHYYPGNVDFQSPDIEMLRLFDLFDRGFDPDSAVGWMNTNGYPTKALWYPPPEKGVMGLQYVYIATRGKVAVNGTWDIVVRVE